MHFLIASLFISSGKPHISSFVVTMLCVTRDTGVVPFPLQPTFPPEIMLSSPNTHCSFEGIHSWSHERVRWGDTGTLWHFSRNCCLHSPICISTAFLHTHPRVRPDGPGKKEEKERARPFFELLLASFTFFIRFYLADLRAFSSSWKVEKTVKKNPPRFWAVVKGVVLLLEAVFFNVP